MDFLFQMMWKRTKERAEYSEEEKDKGKKEKKGRNRVRKRS